MTGSVYGGGLGQPAVAEQAPIPANVNGTVTVTVRGGTAYNVYGCNNLQGAPQQAVTVNIQGGTINNNVYGGGDQGAVGGNTTVTLKDNVEVNGNVFGGGNEAEVSGSATVNIEE